MLHPQHKLDYFKKAGWEEEWITKAKEIVRTEFERSYKYRDVLDEGCGPKDETLTSKVCKFIITDLGQN